MKKRKYVIEVEYQDALENQIDGVIESYLVDRDIDNSQVEEDELFYFVSCKPLPGHVVEDSSK